MVRFTYVCSVRRWKAPVIRWAVGFQQKQSKYFIYLQQVEVNSTAERVEMSGTVDLVRPKNPFQMGSSNSNYPATELAVEKRQSSFTVALCKLFLTGGPFVLV